MKRKIDTRILTSLSVSFALFVIIAVHLWIRNVGDIGADRHIYVVLHQDYLASAVSILLCIGAILVEGRVRFFSIIVFSVLLAATSTRSLKYNWERGEISNSVFFVNIDVQNITLEDSCAIRRFGVTYILSKNAKFVALTGFWPVSLDDRYLKNSIVLCK